MNEKKTKSTDGNKKKPMENIASNSPLHTDYISKSIICETLFFILSVFVIQYKQPQFFTFLWSTDGGGWLEGQRSWLIRVMVMPPGSTSL